MKRYFYLIAVMILCQSIWAQNQIITTITPRVSSFPSTGLSYVDDPSRYFSIQMINTTGTSMDVFFTIELVAEFTASNQNYYIRTKKEIQPLTPLTVGVTPVIINRAIFDQVVGHLNTSAYETNYDRNKLVQDMLQLPEGQYRFCITPYQWDGYNNPNPIQVGEQTCYTFSICYTGSAPEFTAPISGLSANNLNNSNPTNNILRPTRRGRTMETNISLGDRQQLLANSSDIRDQSQYTRLPLSKQLIFNWTGVISNCLSPNDFDYYFKIVEVTGNQNIQEAINNNATVTTYNNRSNTTYIHDTISNRHFRLQPGHVYAAQVQAVLKKNLMSAIQLSNGGKSQIITFVWGQEGPVVLENGASSSMNSTISDNHEDVLSEIRNPYFVSPGQDNIVIDALRLNLATEISSVLTMSNNLHVTDVDEGDMTFYQVPVADTFGIRWMPVCGDSILKVNYTVELYEYNGGAANNSMIGLPLKTYTTTVQQVHDFTPANAELMSLAGEEWIPSLEEGYKYLIHLKAETFYSYRKTTTYKITDFIHNMPIERDSVVHTVAYGSKNLFSDVVFSWGIDSNALDQIYPPQFTYPQNNSLKQWDDTLMTEIPSVQKFTDFKFQWKNIRGVNYEDTVYYKLLVAKLPKGKTPQQVKDTLFFKDSITTNSYIDTALYDSLKIDGQYMAVVWAYVKQVEDQSVHYNLINDGKSIYATFKLIEPREYNADLNNKYKCSPKALDNLSKTIITPPADSLINNKVRLMMGEFPIVLQQATFDKDKKRYSGDGYVVWHPTDVDVLLKVQIDTIQINDKFQIINGTAVSTATDSSLYMPALMNDLNLDEWTGDDINRLASQFGAEEEIKGYYDKIMEYGEKYGARYGGLVGPLFGGNAATPVLTFPISISDEELTGSENVTFSVNNMFFSPVTALMNIWAIFAAQDDNYYVPFVANNICMDQKSFFGKTDQHIDLFMARSYEKEINDDYVLRFKASSNFADPKDGTLIAIDTGKFSYLRAEIELDLNSNDFRGLNQDGLPQKGNVVHANLQVKLSSWSAWVAKVSMDPFAVAGADRFTFYPTGRGIYYDHSDKETPKEVSLTYDYLFGSPAPANMSEDEKKKLTKATKEWQGFYWDNLKVFLSDEISNTFSDTTDFKDSMVVYKYGLNNTVVDSVHYSYPETRINFGAKGLIIDKYGFTTDIFVHDIIDANTKDGGGWAFSLDTVSIKFVKNDYKHAIIKGGFGVPLFKGGFVYDCTIGADSLTFNVEPRKDTMDLDLWAASVNFLKESSYFRIKKIYKEPSTRVDLTLNGHISIKTDELGIPGEFEFIKFEHMGMRNYNLSGKPAKGTASIDKFEFDIGEWSFASPQKFIGGTLDGGKGGGDALGSVNVGGFTFSLLRIDPIVEYMGDDLKLGVVFAGKMKFESGDCDFGATTGFALWGVTQPKNHFKVKEVKGRLDSIRLDNIDFMVFKMSGVLNFTYGCESCTDVSGFKGNLKITVMDVVDLTMSAGFGKEKDNKGEYSWWFFDGACKFPGGIPLGAVSINGFSGGFAYNMKAKGSLTDAKYSAKGLLSVAEKNDDKESLQLSGMDFDPSRDSWVANAGISLILTGAKNTMNADGLVSLRITNKHFSGLFIEANAYMVTKMNDATPGDGKNNSSALIKAKTIIGFESVPDYYFLRFSLCVNAKLSLKDLLDGVGGSTLDNLTGKISGAIHQGVSIATNPNIATAVDQILGTESQLSSHTEGERDVVENAANASAGGGNSSSIGASMIVKIPFDFEMKYYKKTKDGNKKGDIDWYVALGKPKWDERVQIKQTLNLMVLKSETEFTFYMQTGNAFAYEMPPLSKELQDFFGLASDDKKLDANKEQVSKSRRISNTDWLKIDKGGGFCLGASFHAGMEMNFFLYLDLSADLGFDVALLDVNGLGCPGYPNIGKNDFYALGRIYAALQGDVGLKLNLGFWKGKISLFSAGVGALLQGGGPNPSYCYGLLRFKVRMLGGLINFSTSCDFAVGDVCVPGAGDPLANVKLFESVTPGYDTEKQAAEKASLQSPLQIGTIVSNMPWNREVFLAENDGSNARRFRFQLMTANCKYYSKTNQNGSYGLASGNNMMNYTYSNKDENVMLFETKNGGLIPNAYNKLKLQARAFEYRRRMTGKELGNIQNDSKADVMYNYSTGTVSNSNPPLGKFGWFDPLFFNDKTNKYDIKPYKKDSTFYFKTMPLSEDLNGQVVFSWPYNGETHFPAKEYAHVTNTTVYNGITGQYHTTNYGPMPSCKMYLYLQRNDLLDKNTLAANGKELKIYLLKNGLEDGEIAECSYNYYSTLDNNHIPNVSVTLPDKEYGLPGGYGPHMLQFFVVDKDAYNSALQAAMESADMTIKQAEYSSRISDETYALAAQAHNQASGRGRRGSTNGGGSGSHTLVDFGDSGFETPGGTRPRGQVSSGGSNGVIFASMASNTNNTSGNTLAGSALRGIAGSSNNNSTMFLSGTVITNTAGSGNNTIAEWGNRQGDRMVTNTHGRLVDNTTGSRIVSSGNGNTSGSRIVSSGNGHTSGAIIVGSGNGNNQNNAADAASNNLKPILEIPDDVIHAVASPSSSSSSSSYVPWVGNSSISLSDQLDIQNEMLDEIYMDKQEVGKDSMTYYRTMLKEGYKISVSIGKPIYQWTWFVDPYYETYTDMLLAYFGQNFQNFDLVLQRSTVEDKTSYLQVNPQSANDPMGTIGFLFHKYSPNDNTRYKTDCEMPPICYFVLNRTLNNTMMKVHNRHFQYLLDLESDFKKTELASYFHCYKDDGKIKYKSSGDKMINSTYHFSQVIKNGLPLNNTSKFLSVNRRIKGGTLYTQCVAANYHPNSWDVPCILETCFNNQERTPMPDYLFETQFANAGTWYTPSSNTKWSWYIKDYASVAIADDIKKIRKFMSENQKHARALDCRGWSHKRNILEKYCNDNNLNAIMTYSDFPLDMPEIYRVNHFMKAMDVVVDYTRNNKSYLTTNYKHCRFYNGNYDYIPVDMLQFQERLWAKYWWSSAAQCLDLEEHGFDRDFYFDKNGKYYNTMEPLNSDGKHGKSDKLSTIQGAWYADDPDMMNTWGFVFNNVSVCFLTSQNSDFSDNLNKMAVAVKKSNVQNDLIFFPNATLTNPQLSTFYTIDLRKFTNTSKFLTGYMSGRKSYMIEESYGND